MTFLRDAWRWLAEEPRQLQGLRILQIFLGGALLFRVFTEARFSEYLWGSSGLAQDAAAGPGSDILDPVFATQLSTWGVLGVLMLGALGLSFGYQTRVAALLACAALHLLSERLPILTDGGDNIAQLVLIYMIFALPVGAKPARGSLAVWIHNIAVLAITLQLVVLYATSGLLKVSGEKWGNGVALYYISQVEWFSLPAVQQLFLNPLIVTMATYVPMLYQVLFPIAIISPIKLPWLAVGISFHIGIAIVMGLVTFSAVMIGLELFLISDTEYAGLQARWASLSQALARRRILPNPAARQGASTLPSQEPAMQAEKV